MAESFQQYIKIRTFLGYRPKEILIELQNAFGTLQYYSERMYSVFSGNEAPNYASVQRWSKRFRDAIESPSGSQSNFEIQESNTNMQKQINTNANNTPKSIHNLVNRLIVFLYRNV